jgi:hypothetical protein
MGRSRIPAAVFALAIAGLAAGAASAQTAVGATAAPRPAIDLSSRHQIFAVAYDQAGPARIPGIARTAVDVRLAPRDLTGSMGFLCGIQPGADRSGIAAARGVDPTGRFVGAKLSLAFR